MNIKLPLEKFLMAFLLSSAVLGYVVSVGKFYLFHLAAVFYLVFLSLGFVKMRTKAIQLTFPLLLFIFFAIVSLLWAPSFTNGLYYVFYFSNAFFIVFALVNYASTPKKLNYVFMVLATFLSLNFFVGVLETTGHFRLPMSPYYGDDLTAPSGFNANLNNFGFVLLICFPFLFLYHRNWVRFLACILVLWIAFRLGSKGFFLGILAFFAFYFAMELNKKRTWGWIGLLVVAVVTGGALLSNSFEEAKTSYRIFTVFEQIDRGVALMTSDNVVPSDSTSIRSFIYLQGIKQLVSSYGAGLGIAGIGTKLAKETDFFGEDKSIYSFHNFFLEMLIDFGVFPFVIMMYFYLRLVYSLKTWAKRTKDLRLQYFAKSSCLSLLTALPASIAPSSIIYIFTFWLLVGFSIATLSCLRQQELVLNKGY